MTVTALVGPSRSSERRTGAASAPQGRRLPIRLLDVEVSAPLPDIGGDPLGPASALILVRFHRCPVGRMWLDVPPAGLGAAELAGGIWSCLAGAINEHRRDDGLAPALGLGLSGLPEVQVPPCLLRRASVTAEGPLVTVAVATRERPDQLRTCLRSLLQLDYPRFEIVVVDNAPVTDATKALVDAEFSGALRYVQEPRRGLAAAHNRALEEARGTIIAFTDDDVAVDPDWLGAIVEGFTLGDRVGAVTGLIHPAELVTDAQLLLEQHGDFGKGFVPRLFDRYTHRLATPMYPFTAGRIGSGANMAFDADVLRRLGGFDPAMGTGTASRGGDDLMAFFSVIASGYQVAYHPAALVHHHHRRDEAALGRQAFGYGVGLGAYLTNAVLHHPLMALAVAPQVPSSTRAIMSLRSARNRSRYATWPRRLATLERRGVLVGPAAYAASRWEARGTKRPGARS